MKNKNTLIIWVTIISIVFVLGSWIINWYLLIDLNPDQRGTIGDMFGTLNALFSGLAFSGIIISILLQNKDLKMQYEELKETREEFKIQNHTLMLQRFENTFFNMINNHHKIIDGMSIKSRKLQGSLDKGRIVFKYTYDDLIKNLDARINNQNGNRNDFDKTFVSYYNSNNSNLGLYFRFLENILQFIDNSEFYIVESEDDLMHNSELIYNVNMNNRKKYADILRSQMSDFELLWIYYFALSSINKGNLKQLIEKYSFLKNLPKNKLYKKTQIVKSFEKNAFE